jgi:hypothetical protein
MNDDDVLKLVASDPEAHKGGPSELKEKLACGRQYILNRRFPEDPLAENCWRRNAGSIAHKLTEYLDAGIDPREHFTQECNNPMLAKSLKTAWVIADGYAEEFPRGFFGTVLDSEVKLTGDIGAGRLDRVFQVDQAAIDRIEARFALNMNGEGVYLWDLKTSGQADSNLSTQYEWGPALYMYTNLALARWPDVRGMLFLNAVPHSTKKDGDFAEFAAALYTVEGQTTELAHARFEVMRQAAIFNSSFEGRCNVMHCYTYGRACRHRLSGACQGV